MSLNLTDMYKQNLYFFSRFNFLSQGSCICCGGKNSFDAQFVSDLQSPTHICCNNYTCYLGGFELKRLGELLFRSGKRFMYRRDKERVVHK